MNADNSYERVPEATQLLTLPFLSAMAGLLERRAKNGGYRVTLHRTMCRDGSIYLQQVTDYFSSDSTKRVGSSRIFPVDRGIIGAAFRNRKLHRTAAFKNLESLEKALQADLRDENDPRDYKTVPYSYFAMPFLGRTEGEQSIQESVEKARFPLVILYAECFRENIFADDDLAGILCAMCNQYAETLDKLANVTLERIRNFSFPINDSVEVKSKDAPFRRLNSRPDEKFSPPFFERLRSFNFEFVV